MKIISVSRRVGDTLGPRAIAAELRDEIISLNQSVQLDFSGVKIISYSFADEFFGKVTEQFGPDVFKTRIILRNVRLDNQPVIQNAMKRYAGRNVEIN
jgi:hypothetical protein